MAYTPSGTFAFSSGAYTPSGAFSFVADETTLTASGEGQATFAGGGVASSTLSASGIGSAAFSGDGLVVGAGSLSASGVGSAAFVGSGVASSTLSASGEGGATFTWSARADFTLTALGEGSAAFGGASIVHATWAASGESLALFAGIHVAKFVISTRYLMTLTDTDTSDIYTLPASSLSISSRSGNPSVINAVIPYSPVYALAIASVTNGLLKIYRSQTDSAGATVTDLIEYGTLGTVQSDIGPKNASIVLTASSTKTTLRPKTIYMHGLQYVATVNGKLRVRCTPSNDLTVGDTVSIGGYTLIANNIQLSVTANLEMMEIYE
jgi:hypothetical protein